MKRFISVFLFISLLALSPARSGIYEPQTFTLPNGLQVVVITNDLAPVVNHMVWYKVGAYDDPQGKSGVAHFLEHMMFKGTARIKEGDFSKIISRHGGRDNAFTSKDYTGYYQTIAKEHLGLVMAMEADRMANLNFSEEIFETERQVVLNERRQRTESTPTGRFYEALWAAAFGTHVYGRPLIGWRNEIEAIAYDDLMDFYRTYYAPNNAIVVISGDITARDVYPLAEQFYGAILPRPVPLRKRMLLPEEKNARTITLQDSGVRQSRLLRLYKAPSFGYGAMADAYGLQILTEILAGGSTSLLHQELVVKQRRATSISIQSDVNSVGQAILTISASPAPGVDIDLLEKTLDAELVRILKRGISQAEIERAKTRFIDAALYAKDGVLEPARLVGAALMSKRDITEIEKWDQRIAQVSPKRINDLLRKLLGPGSYPVTGKLIPPLQENDPIGEIKTFEKK